MKISLKIISVLLIFCLLFSVAGCNTTISNENPSSETSSETSSVSGGHRVDPSDDSSKNQDGNNLPAGNSSSNSSDNSRNQTPGSPNKNPEDDNSIYIPSISDSSESSSSAVVDNTPIVDTPIEDTVNVPQTKNGRTLVWHDEFSGSSLDANKWHFFRTMGADDRIYTNDSKHAYAEDGNFILKAYRSDLNPKKFTLPEGLVTKNTMNFKYGYLEMRAKIPMRQGAWPSFWMLSDTVFKKASWKSEIDIFECFGHSSDLDVCLHKHNGKLGGSLPRNSKFYTGNRTYSFPAGTGNDVYHVFGLEWDANYLKFSIDGKVYVTIPIDNATVASWGDSTTNADGYHDFHYIIMNNELLTDGGWYKHSSESRVKDHTQFPFTYTIDYVRLYQKAGEELKVKADIDAAR